MKLQIFLFSLFMLAAGFAGAQGQSQGESMVVYDPLFWKDELKLDNGQCQKIKQINSAFYEMISGVAHEESNRTVLQRKAAQSLLKRSEDIWDTFHPKQRKRWKRLWQETYHARANET